MTAPDDELPLVDIVIPTYQRAHLVRQAAEAALAQSWWKRRVTVIDDASTDGTEAALSHLFARPDFTYVRLARNVGTASAKNAGLLLTGGGAVTFHDSDDIPHRDKVLRQLRVLTRTDIRADECLNWMPVGIEPATLLPLDAVLVHHRLVLPDGREVEIRRDLSLVDDVFPNLQMGAEVPGEWTHINSGLFRASVFARWGGFEPCIEEDREFRNRLILNGGVVWVLRDLLLTKFETPDSLTQAPQSDYVSARRRADRQMVWDRVAEWRRTGRIAPATIDLPDLEIDYVSAPDTLRVRALPMTPATREAVARIVRGPLAGEAAE